LIKTQDLKTQIDELTKQNDMVLTELEQVKKIIMSKASSNASSSNSAGQQDAGQENAGQTQQNNNSSTKSSNSDSKKSSGQVSDLATDLLKIKDLVEKLEQKTSQYVSTQSGGGLTEKDVVNLVLTLMNGMVDWAAEFLSNQGSGSGQMQ
jgi:hypothetical protein